MCEQIIVWRDDFENIPLEEWFVEKWGYSRNNLHKLVCGVDGESGKFPSRTFHCV